MSKNLPNAKGRILKAAIKVFAEKSFAGSRVEDIAAEAGVPKSLIYYHFKSKNEMLEDLMEHFIERFKELIRVAENDTHQAKAEVLLERIRENYSSYFQENADLLRIVFIESLIKTDMIPRIFFLVESLVEVEESFPTSKENKRYNRNERLVAEFFTNIIPSIAYLCFQEAWAKHFKVSKKSLKDLYLKVFMQTHGAYHKYHD